METVETAPDGIGFAHFDLMHISWLALFVAVCVVNCLLYRRLSQKGRGIWKKTVALLILADELFKMAMLFAGGRYMASYLPLHLCSINIFVILVHAWRPNKLFGGFLYAIGIPGAMFALLFPTWTKLPLMNFMHLHSFTIHILLCMYPVVLMSAGELQPTVKQLHKYLLLLLAFAVPIYGINLLLDTNFMFLMSADPGNPLYFFQQTMGSHLFGFPILLVAVMAVMFLPLELYRLIARKMKK